MKATQFVVVALVLLGINANLAANGASHKADLSSPAPCKGDSGSQGSNGQGSCINGDYSSNIRKVSYESAIELIGSSKPIESFRSLAAHVISVSKQALGYSAVLSDDTLASLAWIFRLRHMPDPVVYAAKTTRFDVARIVRYALTRPEVVAEHQWAECDINALIEAVKTSVEHPSGFVFRMVSGAATEYGMIGLHQLEQRLHFFSAVHNEEELFVSVVSSSLKGEFIKGHGKETAIAEREEAATFLRQWLLNQWVNLWTCTNHQTGTN
jgi:hypothetical protein